jgi:hypothetical protein
MVLCVSCVPCGLCTQAITAVSAFLHPDPFTPVAAKLERTLAEM